MKKLLLFLLIVAGALNVMAQNITPESDFVGHHNDYVKPHKEKKKKKQPKIHEAPPLPKEHAKKVKIKKQLRPDNSSGWCIDLNAVGGVLTQQVNSSGLVSGYGNSINTKISNPQFNNGGAYGIDAEVAYFIGRKKHFGLGTGLMYIYDHSAVTVNDFHTEYQSTDNFGNTFRQELTADGQIKETWRTSNFNIPLLLKYKTRFSDNVGFTVDAGVLFNLVENTDYKTNAAFDYEADYQYVATEGGGVTTVYDNAATPASTDLLITKSQYLSTHTSAGIESYFNSLRAQGYNVGLGVTPNSNTGHVSEMSSTVGLLLRPAINVYLSENLSLNLGVWYLYQDFSNNATPNYRITDKVGTYNPILNSASGAANNTYGISAGLRYSFSKRMYMEPSVAPETNDETIEEKTPPANNDYTQPAATSPNREEDQDEPENDRHVDISTPLLFDENSTVIKRSSYPIIREAIKELKNNPDAYLVIHGYTDNTGPVGYNRVLSKKRANAVKNYLRHHGVRTRTIQTIGHGPASPAASNRTRSGRARNRRAVIKLKEQDQQ